MTSKREQCAATRGDGQPCRAPALPGSAYCFNHDPDRAEARARARQKGGRNRAKIVRLRGLIPPRLLPVFDTLEGALAEVHDGTLEPAKANAMANLARAMTAVLTAGELEARVRMLEGKTEAER
jgi:hypothetical protein